MNKSFSVIFCLIFWMSSLVHACSVPVFRYALERWDQDRFSVHVFYKDSLDNGSREKTSNIAVHCSKILDPENIFRNMDISGYSNILLGLANCNKGMDEYTKFVFDSKTSDVYPRSVVRFAFKTRNNYPLWDGPLTKMPFERIIDSPVRKKIAKRLIDGESVVWVLVKSGDQKVDLKALKTLQKGLDTSLSTIKLQEMTEEDKARYISKTRPTVKLSISYVTIEATDSAETFFRSMILNSEPLLKSNKIQPVAAPVFGRGRLLYLLAGDGITVKNVLDANGFLCGPCACTIKDGNPGTDCLFSFDWNSEITDTLVQNEPMPPLQGFESFIGSQSGSSKAANTKGKQLETTSPDAGSKKKKKTKAENK